MKKLYTLATVLFLLSCGDEKPEETTPPPNTVKEPASISYSIVNIYPHDTSSFTQGLEWHDGYLYEGTGMKGESHLMKVNLKDGKAVKKISLDAGLFGEGITILKDKIYQLTWQEHKVLVYDLKTWKKLQEFPWSFEGWGITNDGTNLIISTGSNNLYFVDPANFRILNTISVFSNYGPEGEINELEYVNGKIYANKWNQDYVYVINPQTGAVEGKLSMEGLLEKSGKPRYENTDVLNGIAYDSAKKSFYITGKRWPSLFEVKLN
jgi:glutaminyl-peptide cyclotransferase